MSCGGDGRSYSALGSVAISAAARRGMARILPLLVGVSYAPKSPVLANATLRLQEIGPNRPENIILRAKNSRRFSTCNINDLAVLQLYLELPRKRGSVAIFDRPRGPAFADL